MSKPFYKITTALIILLSASFAQADLVSEFGVSLSKNSLNNFLSQISGDFKIEDESIELEKEGILKDLNYSSSKLFLDANLEFLFTNEDVLAAHAAVKTAGIKLKDFSYTQVTEVNETGLKAKVTTKMECSEISVAVEDWAVALTAPVVFKDGRIELDRTSGNLNTLGDAVRIDLSKCDAPKGIEIVLNKMILEWIKSSDGNEVLFGAVLNYGQDFIDSEFERLKNILNLEILDKKIDIVFEAVSFLKDKIEVVGLLTAESEKNDYLLTMRRADFDKVETSADVILPKEFFTKMFPDFMKEASVNFELTRADVPDVDVLFNNRFLQFFVWGDLLNFKKSSDFAAGIQLNAQELVLDSMGENLKYKLKGVHQIDMDFLNSRGTHYPYINFSGKMAADLNLSFTDNGVSIEITNPDLRVRSRWDEQMSTWRKSKAKGKPWMSVITPRIEKAFDKTKFDYSWKDFGLGDYIQKAHLYQSDRSMIIGVSLN